MSWLYLECREGEKRRFYRITLFDTLFGEYGLRREWGRIDCQNPQELINTFCSNDERSKFLLQLLRVRDRHGYSLVNTDISWSYPGENDC